MNLSFKPRFRSAKQGKPSSQASSEGNLSDIGYRSSASNEESNQAASVYGGTVSSFKPVLENAEIPQPSTAANTGNWSTSVQTVLEVPPSNLPYKLLLGAAVFSLAFGAWAWFGKIEQVGHAQGQLVPKGQVYKIDPVEGGRVVRIAVKEGQTVKVGQMLVELDAQLAKSEVERLQQTLATDKMQLSQTQSLIDKIHLEAKTLAKVADADLQAQEQAIAQVQENAATSRELMAQLQTDAAANQARQERLKPFVKEGALAKDYLFQAEQAVRDRQRTITESQGELKQALAEANQLQAGLIQKQAEKHKAQLEAQQRIQQLEVEMTQLKAKIAETQNLLNSAKTKLVQNFLYAPVNGYISSLNIRNRGQVVQPGQTIAEMAPHSAPLVLSAILPNQEAGFVKTGMPVQVKLDAYPYQDYGIVPGKVISISPDAKRDERLGPVYQVEVALERNYVTANAQTIKFKPGQTATADIVIRRRRIIDILLEPIQQLQKGGINL